MMTIRKTIGGAVMIVAALLLISAFNGHQRVSAEEVDTLSVATKGILKLTSGDMGTTKHLRVFPGKSVVVDMPSEVRDVLIASPETADAVVHTTTRIYLIGKKAGQTNAIFFDKNGKRLLTLNIEVGGGKFHDLEKVFERIMPGTSIKIESIGNTILLSGTVKTPIQASRAGQIARSYFAEFKESISAGVAGGEGTQKNMNKEKKKGKVDIINMLAVEAREQVMLKVQVVEMNRKIVKQLGVDLNAAAQVGGTTFSVLSQTPFGALGKELAVGGYVSGVVPGAAYYTPNGAAARTLAGNARITHLLKAMEQNGVVKTLAEPNLTAITGETAKFHAGGKFPYTKCEYVDGKRECSTEWELYGVVLNFTPVVLSEGRISLQIKTEVSELEYGASVNLPIINSRNAESTVELPSGGSMMMAGLISEKTQQAMTGLPGLQKLPVLGSLFRSRDFVKKESELVILVTPYVVKPVANRKLTTPDAGFAPSSDTKATLLGQFNRVYGRKGRLPKGREHGDYGFIVE